jgi:hypothetical protein
MINPVTDISGKERYPIKNDCLKNSLNSKSREKVSFTVPVRKRKKSEMPDRKSFTNADFEMTLLLSFIDCSVAIILTLRTGRNLSIKVEVKLQLKRYNYGQQFLL